MNNSGHSSLGSCWQQQQSSEGRQRDGQRCSCTAAPKQRGAAQRSSHSRSSASLLLNPRVHEVDLFFEEERSCACPAEARAGCGDSTRN